MKKEKDIEKILLPILEFLIKWLLQILVVYVCYLIGCELGEFEKTFISEIIMQFIKSNW